MVALKAERRVFLWRVRPKAAPADAVEQGKTANLEEFISVLEAEHAAKRARVYLSAGSRILEDDAAERDEKNQIYVASISRDLDRHAVTLLINRGDPEVVSPAFLNANKNSVRTEHPKAGETPGWSAHLVISTKENGGAHRACFEQMPRVSSSIVLNALDRIVARALIGNPSYTYDVIQTVKGKTKVTTKAYRPSLDAARVPSENLLEDLEAGSLRTVTLTKKAVFYEGPGVMSTVRRQEEKIVLTLNPVDKPTVTAFLGKLLQRAKEEEYESVTFNVTDLPGDQTSSPTLDLGDQDALEHLYVRAKRLHGFEEILEQCYSEACTHIADKMVTLLNDEKEW